MRGSLFLGRVFGIRVLMHFTFLLLFVYIAYTDYRQHLSLNDILFHCGLTLAVFFCVLVHEFGHALTARRYGIKTKQILLLPVGGVAQLERMPENPWQELIVTIAGPLMNVIIALLISPFMLYNYSLHQLTSLYVINGHFFLSLMWINVMLVAFNLIPAYPMDGGRILRALLAFKFNYASSTRVAARIGQLMAIGIIVAGLFLETYIWIALGLFVGILAELELRMVLRKYSFKGHTIAEIADPDFYVMSPLTTLAQAEEIVLKTGASGFIVIDEGMVAGVVTKKMMQGAEAAYESSVLIGTIMKTDFPRLKPDMPAEKVYNYMQDNELDILPVMNGLECAAAVTLEKLTALKDAGPLRQFALHTKAQFNMGLSGEFESTL
jgi:Zn-dependent protease/CBS domain-containing protein